ncbi:MAG: glycoside hydrolase family 43 protein, partial [Acidimicrobiia bacterium]|nr:glycoside hydrolase family 43 protein [Acidimicrobiia bacterium]
SGMSAGIAVFQNEQHHFYLGVRRVDSEWSIFLEQAAGGEPEAFVERALSSGDGDSIELRVDAEGRPYSFTYRLEGGDWITLAEGLDGSILSTHVAGGFVGSYIGLHVRVE